ncbi:MAG: UDP-N-acetylmuramoyl-tripeptide--D-alanyl-D-alanine ligase [Candidatus Methylomirabilis oxygeniifera]|uniref:Putative UDP-N-acetylmuramoyl-tripeptide--D-alanyl-D-alanine ligase n=1 Tax=Methylomirabilis oxygeniifera TaxID=671143 RepID=D5MI59_METO1|nr:MAG: UDP-N-acetylmuramoyl-tripeptide--D-alanyl-D-alanine ligase [Candidatus Methylomirabilis oxyfera]CBE69352.1 putative UDP-N-acetylmuramoyl-tripeptide--D-alanyl-D-alanine ligase [Candidatus Methylomirabilis oxyfera]
MMQSDTTLGSSFAGRAVTGLLPYVAVAVARHLDLIYLAQLERYNGARLRGWIVRHWGIVLDGRGVLVQAAVLGAGILFACLPLSSILGFRYVGIGMLYIVWLAAGIWLRTRYTSLQVSQRLQWTSRTVRLAAVTSVLAAAVLLVISWSSVVVLSRLTVAPRTLLVGIGLVAGLFTVSEVAAGTILAANASLAPLERTINRRFYAQATARMRRYPGEVIGITGSYGKTTTKFITAALLHGRYPVFKTPDGVNTTMGIVRVVREGLRDDHRFFVVEVAAYGPGEIREVCEVLRPRIGILTAVGVQHLERFGTPERIAEAKYELIDSLPPDGLAIVNADDPVCLRLAERARQEGRRVLLYGIGEDERALGVRGKDVTLSSKGSAFRVETGHGAAMFETRLLGGWNIGNILGATAAALECGVPLEEIAAGVRALAPAPKRLEIREEGGVIKLIDVANANPRGAQMALEVLSQFEGGSKILITPGLVELGQIEAEENRRLGRAAAAVCDYVVLVGPQQTQPLQEGLREAGFSGSRVLIARHADEVADCLKAIVCEGDVLLYENRLPDTYLEFA